MKGTEDMPEPQTIDYEKRLKISQKFVDDVIPFLSSQAYVDVHDMIDTIMNSCYIIPVGVLNEIVQRIGKFPYSQVKHIMSTLETNQGAYFTLYVPPTKETETTEETATDKENTETDASTNIENPSTE